MTICEIYEILDKIAPFSAQEPWDNSGLLLGSMQGEIERVYLSLDVDLNLLENLEPNSLLITHHPLIFKGLKKIDTARYPSSLIAKMLSKNISLIAMHTNYDKAVLNEYFVREILGLDIYKKDEFLAFCEVKFEFEELVHFIKQKLGLNTIRAVKAKSQIRKIAICTGSGMDLAGGVDADCFLTGDIKYHQALEAAQNGLSLIDISHFESERYFGESLAKHLQNFSIPIIITNSKNPFMFY